MVFVLCVGGLVRGEGGGVHSIIKMIYILIYTILKMYMYVPPWRRRAWLPAPWTRCGGSPRWAAARAAAARWSGRSLLLLVWSRDRFGGEWMCVYVCVLCVPPNTHTTNNKNPTHQSARSQSRGRAPAAPRPRGKGSGGNPHRGRPSAARHGASARRVSRGRTRPSRGAGWACRRRRVGRAPKGGDCLGVDIL